MAKHELWELQSMQASPLNVKVLLTKQRIRDWVHEYGQDGVYVSFSGGKDSTVLLHLVRELYPDIPAVYCNTGLEYPEITQFVKTFDNVTIIKPKMNFFQVCEKYGFPLISKEVSECVSGARKYLASVIEEQNKMVKRSEQRCIYCGDLLGKKGCLGMCNKHYIQYKRCGDPLHADKKERATVDGYYRDGKTGRREHRVIWENHYGIKLKKDEIIHHINFVKTDNRIENLYKYDNASDHIKAHRQFERLMDSLTDDEEIYFEDGEYCKRERERVHSDRQKWHYQKYRQLCGQGEYAKNPRGGEYDRKYRKLRGIGEFSTATNGRNSTGLANLASDSVLQNRGGGAARDFANLTGIRTSTPRTVDPRLWKNYRQFADTTSDGDKQSERQSDDGDYP